MDNKEFERFLHQQIPITKAMGFRVLEFTPEKVKIAAPLAPNINHKLTAFGGSINCLMTVCGWSLTFANINPLDINAHVVIGKSNIKYLLPIKADFTAEAQLSPMDKKRFIERYEKHNRSILNISCRCCDEDMVFAKFDAQYIVFNDDAVTKK